jgi:hypothetical protein
MRCRSVNLVQLRAILKQMSQSLADVTDDRRFRLIRLRDRKDDRLNIIDYQSHHC